MQEPFRGLCERVHRPGAGRVETRQLVYRKRLRRKLDDYERNIPPHVQAAQVYRAGWLVPYAW